MLPVSNFDYYLITAYLENISHQNNSNVHFFSITKNVESRVCFYIGLAVHWLKQVENH